MAGRTVGWKGEEGVGKDRGQQRLARREPSVVSANKDSAVEEVKRSKGLKEE